MLQKKPLEAEKALLTARQYGNFPTLVYELASVRYAAGLYYEAAAELRTGFGIKDGVLGSGSFAKVAFFVFAVLYVFQNEVSLRVARTVQKRVRRLMERVERGDEDVDEKDVRMLEGWRWRVLLW